MMKAPSIKNPNSPHFWWLFSVLSLAIIALVSFILSDRIASADKIMEYISYASVILSVTLSVFAILYTYTSNVQIQQQFEKINIAADNITSASNHLNIMTNKLDKNLDDILKRLKSIDDAQQEIRSNVNFKVEQQASNINNVHLQTSQAKTSESLR